MTTEAAPGAGFRPAPGGALTAIGPCCVMLGDLIAAVPPPSI